MIVLFNLIGNYLSIEIFIKRVENSNQYFYLFYKNSINTDGEKIFFVNINFIILNRF